MNCSIRLFKEKIFSAHLSWKLLLYPMNHNAIPNITSRGCTCHSVVVFKKTGWNKEICASVYLYTFFSGVTEINTNTLKHHALLWKQEMKFFLKIYFQVFVSVPNLIFLHQIRRESLSQLHEQCEWSSFPVVEAEESIFYSEALCQIKSWHVCVLVSVTFSCKMKNPQQWWCKEFEKKL